MSDPRPSPIPPGTLSAAAALIGASGPLYVVSRETWEAHPWAFVALVGVLGCIAIGRAIIESRKGRM